MVKTMVYSACARVTCRPYEVIVLDIARVLRFYVLNMYGHTLITPNF
jgi:hypothetical protein